jgi:hypothetical protein
VETELHRILDYETDVKGIAKNTQSLAGRHWFGCTCNTCNKKVKCVFGHMTFYPLNQFGECLSCVKNHPALNETGGLQQLVKVHRREEEIYWEDDE